MYHCCGYDNLTTTESGMVHPSCLHVTNNDGGSCCPETTSETDCCVSEGSCACPLCKEPLTEVIGSGFSAVGGVGLFFSFLEVCCISACCFVIQIINIIHFTPKILLQ